MPKEVTQVAHLINIGLDNAESGDVYKQFVTDRLPSKNDEFKYKTYSLYETIAKNKPEHQKKYDKKTNSKQRKALFNLKKEKFNFNDFHQINQLWKSYFDSVLSEVKTVPDQLKLARADYHGALFTVHASKNPSVVGINGYVIQESKQTFRILTRTNRLLSKSIK